MKIETGYVPGVIGSIAEMHARYYSRTSGFGAEFESKVAAGLADFVSRLERPCNQIWHVSENGRVQASIAVDGEDLGKNFAHLRWFLIDDNLRGHGLGNKMMRKSLQFCDDRSFDKVILWTFEGLDAARSLYEKNGFQLVEEWQGDQWGTVVSEQRFERDRAEVRSRT
ncbi:MAG: GNAT family N-acetyltransferase [Pseudomonadota bacterium]